MPDMQYLTRWAAKPGFEPWQSISRIQELKFCTYWTEEERNPSLDSLEGFSWKVAFGLDFEGWIEVWQFEKGQIFYEGGSKITLSLLISQTPPEADLEPQCYTSLYSSCLSPSCASHACIASAFSPLKKKKKKRRTLSITEVAHVAFRGASFGLHYWPAVWLGASYSISKLLS